MQRKIKLFLVGVTCLAILCGCSQAVDNDTEGSNDNSGTTTVQKTEKNVFYPSSTTEKERFYLRSENGIFYYPFEVCFDENYSQLTCTLYEYKDNAWNKLEKMDIELSGDTFWFLVSQMLTQTSVRYQSVNPYPSNTIPFGGISFQTVEPDFGTDGTSTSFNFTREVNIIENEEFPVIANIMWKDTDKSIMANTDDFYHPDHIDLEDNEAYFMLTFTFSK